MKIKVESKDDKKQVVPFNDLTEGIWQWIDDPSYYIIVNSIDQKFVIYRNIIEIADIRLWKDDGFILVDDDVMITISN